jgi:hypothetical protein
VSRGISRRTTSERGSVGNRGTCPVCRKADLPLRMADGKIIRHGKSAANPRGCDGSNRPPLRRNADGTESEQTGATVIGFRTDAPPPVIAPVDAEDEGLPAIVIRSREDADLPLGDREPPPLPPVS